jgi:hypothetical protein
MGAVELTGLWERKDINGITYLSDRQNGTGSIMVMPNTLKKESGDPDYFLYIKPNKEKQSGEKPEERPLKAKTNVLHKFFEDFFT